MELAELIDHDITYWLEALPPYQKNVINQLYEAEEDYEIVAKKWLTASPANTVPFGVEKQHSVFYEKVLDEIELFLRKDKKYEEQCNQLLQNTSCLQTVVVSALSAALGSTMGVAASFLAPVIVIILGIIGHIGVNAWLDKREEERQAVSK